MSQAIIPFVGAQGSGKTSTLYYVLAELKIKGYSNVASIMELARYCPYPINKSGDFRAQFWMITEQIRQEADLKNRWDIVLSDRSVIDPYIYYFYLYNHTIGEQRNIDFLRKIAENWMKLSPYKLIFYFKPLPLKPDPDRPNDLEFQQEIDRIFGLYLANYSNVIIVNQGETYVRREFVLQKILELIKNGEST